MDSDEDTGFRRPDRESDGDSTDDSDGEEDEKTARYEHKRSDAYFIFEIFHSVSHGQPNRIRKIAPRYDLNAERDVSFLLASIFCAEHEGLDIYSDSRVAEVLLSLGARPTGRDLGETVRAVGKGVLHKKFIGLLLRAGADVNEPFRELATGVETTPFRVSLGYRDPYLSNRLMRCGGRVSSHADVREMVMHDNQPLLEQAVRDGWDPLVRHEGLTHLEALCCNKRHISDLLPTARWLMDRGATLTQRTPEDGPLISYLLYQYAMRDFQLAAVVWFLDRGAGETIGWLDRYGDSPLSVAVAGNAEAVVRLLLSRGARPDSGDALRKATGEIAYHPESLLLIRPIEPVSERIVSILRGERVDGSRKPVSALRMNYR